MRVGILLAEPSGPDPRGQLRDQIQRAADDGLASAWLSNIFGLDALTALAAAGCGVPGIELARPSCPPTPGTRRRSRSRP